MQNSLLVENEMDGKVGETKCDYRLDISVIVCYISVWFCRMVINEMEQ